MKTLPLVIAGCLMASAAPAVPGAERYVESLRLPTGHMVVVAEGDLEPRSIGSYSLRLYSGRNPEFPLDDFVTGVIRPREGSTARVLLADLDGDQDPEIVVVMSSAGSGGHLSADAFRFWNGALSWLASVSGLEPAGDPVLALRARLRTGPPS